MSFKFAVVNPWIKKILVSSEPLNILALATYLQEKGITVKIIDEVASDDALQELRRFSPDLVGITAATCSYPRAVALLKTIKPIGYKTVIGGVHASTMPENSIKDGFDMVVVGEGEKTAFDLIRQGKDKGIFYTPRENILKDGEIPLLDRRLIKMDFYRQMDRHTSHDTSLDFIPRGAPSASLLSSRGCPHQCIYCHNTWRGTPVRFIPVEALMEEIKNLSTQYGIRYIRFLDDDFFLKKGRISDFCHRLIDGKLNVYWAASTRPDSVDDELLSLAAKCGCRRLAFGFESGSQRILDVLNKKSNVEDNLRVAHLCHKHNIDVLGSIMIGNPTETLKDIALTRDFIRKAKFDSIQISTTVPFPGTELWKWCEKDGLIPPDVDFTSFHFSRAPIQMPGTFPPAKIEDMKRKMIVETILFNPKIRNLHLKKFFLNPVASIEKILEFVPGLDKKRHLK